jgi:hypothetical protein
MRRHLFNKVTSYGTLTTGEIFYVLMKLTAIIQGVTKKELCNSIPNVTVRRVLRKRLHLKAYELSIVQQLNTATFGIHL